MTTFSHRAPGFGALLAAGAALLAPGAATAQDCASDADCGAGYRCETYEYQSCSGGGMCAPDGECTDEPVVCETSEYSSCAAAPCASDADCPDRMACHQQSYWVCDGGMAGGAGGAPAGSCRPDGSCDDPDSFPEPTCWEEAGDSLCTPRHQLPCEIAIDCGGGFDCIESIYWVCSGMGTAGAGGSIGAAGSGMEPAPPTEPPSGGEAQDAGPGVPTPDGEYECHEESTGQFYCQLQDLPCGADADCPDGLECKEQYLYPPCMGGGVGTAGTSGTAGTDGAAGGGTDDGMSPPTDREDYVCPEPIVQQRCMPPEYYGGGMPPFPGTGGSTGGSADGGVIDPMQPPSGGSSSGTAGGGGGPTSGEDDNGGEAEETPGNGRGNHFGWLARGCSASGPSSADPIGWLAFGLIALALRRRARDLG
jgi:hypothetical protein